MIEWPEKKKCPVKYPATSEFINGVLYGFNKAIDACKAAVEAAGLGYGLDAKNFKNLKMVRDLIDGMIYKGHIIHAEKTAMIESLDIVLKLAERELITKKAVEKAKGRK